MASQECVRSHWIILGGGVVLVSINFVLNYWPRARTYCVAFRRIVGECREDADAVFPFMGMRSAGGWLQTGECHGSQLRSHRCSPQSYFKHRVNVLTILTHFRPSPLCSLRPPLLYPLLSYVLSSPSHHLPLMLAQHRIQRPHQECLSIS